MKTHSLSNTKNCSSCSTVKQKSDFALARGRADGCGVYCKECSSKKSAEKYSKTITLKTCLYCKAEFLGTQNASYCRRDCRRKLSLKGIDGYKNCIECSIPFPFRLSLKKRGIVSPQGSKIGSVNQTLCSKKCLYTMVAKRNKTFVQTPEMRLKTSLRNTLLFKGKKWSKERCLARRGRFQGDKSSRWAGGITPLNKILRSSVQYKDWRTAVFERDNWTCVFCGLRGGKLHADHIKAFAFYPEFRFELSNGRTLCIPCHKTTSNYAGRARVTQ